MFFMVSYLVSVCNVYVGEKCLVEVPIKFLPGMDAIVTGLSTIVKLRSYNTVQMW